MINIEDYPWLKSKGYLHITPKINVLRNAGELIRKVTSTDFIKNYSFYPLIHSVIVERRYRRDPERKGERFHTKTKNGKVVPNAKARPLHYATHMDALIFGYYAHLISEKYESEIKNHPGLSDCITAYRKLPIEGEKRNKGTIHFAHEVFQYVKERATTSPVVVLKFDIESFFNRMDHSLLKEKWMRLFPDNGRLPPDHFNVFQAATKFSYILKDDLRISQPSSKHVKRSGFDERKLAWIRNHLGQQAFFESPGDFRQAIKSKRLRVYKYPFRDKNSKRICGIPQGLPISSVLANLYLLDFDKEMLKLTTGEGIYRRYSDDIIVVCSPERLEEFEGLVKRIIQESKVSLSPEKTEVFLFKNIHEIKEGAQIVSEKFHDGKWLPGVPLTYLGFEFFGFRTGIKCANLAKFYRRMIKAAKRKCVRAIKLAERNGEGKPVLFYRQLYRQYTILDLSKTKPVRKFTKLVPNADGGFRLLSKTVTPKHKTNYLHYVARAADIMEEPAIKRQISKHQKILRKAIRKNLGKNDPSRRDISE